VAVEACMPGDWKVKLKRWRALSAIFARNGLPVLEFDELLLKPIPIRQV